MDEGKLRIFGEVIPIDLEVEQFSLSNHGGQVELTSFARACSPRHVVIFHADEEGREALEPLLTGEMKVHLPPNQTEIILE